jgi:hypothetical protein
MYITLLATSIKPNSKSWEQNSLEEPIQTNTSFSGRFHCAMDLLEHVVNAKPCESIELRFIVWNAE